MSQNVLKEDFYEEIKLRLHRKIGRELRLAGNIIDLGCGSCDLVRYLVKTYRQKVIGVDISGGSFPKRRHTPDGKSFKCIRKDASHLGFVKNESLDAVVSLLAFHEMQHPNDILSEVFRILRPGGELLVVDFPRGSLAQKLWNEDYYRSDEIKLMLQEKGFKNTKAQLIEKNEIIWAKGFHPPVVAGEQRCHG